MDLSNKFKLLEHVSVTEVDDESVLLDLNSGAYYGLNSVGTQILQSLDKEQGIIALIEELSSTHNVTKSQVRQDAQELLEQLLSEGLIYVDSA